MHVKIDAGGDQGNYNKQWRRINWILTLSSSTIQGQSGDQVIRQHMTRLNQIKK